MLWTSPTKADKIDFKGIKSEFGSDKQTQVDIQINTFLKKYQQGNQPTATEINVDLTTPEKTMRDFIKDEERKSSGKKTKSNEKDRVPEKFDGMVLDRNGNKKLLEPSPILTRSQASKASEECESANKEDPLTSASSKKQSNKHTHAGKKKMIPKPSTFEDLMNVVGAKLVSKRKKK